MSVAIDHLHELADKYHALVSRLPQTVDGHPVFLGHTYWYRDLRGRVYNAQIIGYRLVTREEDIRGLKPGDWVCYCDDPGSETCIDGGYLRLWSTREAAEAAQ